MKTPIFVFAAVFATAVIADSQTNNVAVAADPSGVSDADILALADVSDAGKGGSVELTATGDGKDQLISINCENASIAEILQQFRMTVKAANIISSNSSNMMHRVSIALHDVPWITAMESILSECGLHLDDRNGIYFVVEDQVASPVEKTKPFSVQYASASEVAALLNGTFAKRTDPVTGKPLPKPIDIAVANTNANIVAVTATEKTLSECADLIKAVDRPVPQVYIEARFMSLSAEAMHKLGMQWNSLESWGATLSGVKAGYEVNGGHRANYGETRTQRTVNDNQTDTKNDSYTESTSPGSSSWGDGGGSSTDAGTTTSKTTNDNSNDNRSANETYTTLTPSAIAEAVGAGRTAAQMGWAKAGGFSGQLSVDDFRLALSAFESFGEVKMFSNPRIIVSNGRDAHVDMTTKYPNVTINSSRSSGINEALDISTRIEPIPGREGQLFAQEAFFSWGISLKVTPRISSDGLINVRIEPMISDLADWTTVDGGSGAVYTKYPVISIQQLNTDFSMRDGATAVIGGLSQTKEEDVDSGIPYLRNIPWIGPKLFGWKSREKVQKEIIVFVTVGIANPENMDKDVGLPKNAILGRDYVRGDKLEPGDRQETAAEIMALDMRSLDERKRAAAKAAREDDPVDEDSDRPADARQPAEAPAVSAGPSKVFVPSAQ